MASVQTVLFAVKISPTLDSDFRKLAEENGVSVPDLTRYLLWNARNMLSNLPEDKVQTLCNIAHAKIVVGEAKAQEMAVTAEKVGKISRELLSAE